MGPELMRVARHQELRDQTGPPGLMRGADAAAAVAVKVLIEKNVVAEVWIVLPPCRVMSVERAAPARITQENAREPHGELVGNLIECQEASGAGGAFDLEVVAVVVVKLLQRLDDQEVHGKPDRSAPVGIAAEEARVGLGRLVAHR